MKTYLHLLVDFQENFTKLKLKNVFKNDQMMLNRKYLP